MNEFYAVVFISTVFTLFYLKVKNARKNIISIRKIVERFKMFVLFCVWEVRESKGIRWKVIVKKGSQWECQRFIDKNPEGVSQFHAGYEIEEM